MRSFNILAVVVLIGASPIVLSQNRDSLVAIPTSFAGISTPKPKYPESAKKQRIGGRGIFLLQVDVDRGVVLSVKILDSTGSSLLDRSAVETLRAWRFRPHTVAPKVQVPVNFIP